MDSGLFFNEDCISGCQRHIAEGSVDLIISDPPYGIGGDKLHKHYNRKEEFVLEGYKEVSAEHYPAFSEQWIFQADRILRPGGSIYIVSGYTNLIHVLNALQKTSLLEINHIIWKYNFGVYTRNKFVSSHYHILYYVKPGGPVTFNTFCRYGNDERADGHKSLNYQDREDVWIINREYKPAADQRRAHDHAGLRHRVVRRIQQLDHRLRREGHAVHDRGAGLRRDRQLAAGAGAEGDGRGRQWRQAGAGEVERVGAGRAREGQRREGGRPRRVGRR